MATNNENYIKENTCTSHKRYESMVMYALHYALSDVQLESQFSVGEYFLDGYFPELRLAVEIDEPHHQRTQLEDERRQQTIERELNCEFFRINIMQDSIYKQVDRLVEKVQRLRQEMQIIPWVYTPPEGSTGEFTAERLNALEASGTEEFTRVFRERCASFALDVSDCNIPGHIPKGNGYLGFLVNFESLQLSVSITKTHKPKLLVTRRDEDLIADLGLDLSEPKKGGEYYVIYNFEGRHDPEEVLDYLLTLNAKILANATVNNKI